MLDKSPDRGQTTVSGCSLISALRFNVKQEGKDMFGFNIIEAEVRD